MKRRGNAVWKGGLHEGRGLVSTESTTLSNASYNFSARFENGSGTNPEELIAAAHAACFSMALGAELEKAGLNPEEISTQATATLDRQDGHWRVTAIRLDVRAKVPRATPAVLQAAAETAKAGCPISALLNAPITMTAELEEPSTQHSAPSSN
jgi:osmotically inducible protein OsmC